MKNTWWAAMALVALGTASAASAATVDLTLGTSNQSVTEVGLGGDGSGNGFIDITLGSCSGATCTLSGSYTGGTTGYTAGTYSVLTSFTSGTVSPLKGEVPNASSGNDEFTLISTPATITLDLNENGGSSYAIPIFDGTNFLNAIGVQYDSSATCTGTSACGVGAVSLTDGATITGSVTGSASFDTSYATPTGPGTGTGPVTTATPEPSAFLLSGAGFLGLFGFLRRKTARA